MKNNLHRDIYSRLHTSPCLETPLAVQIQEQLTWLIASGQLQPGDCLPSVRALARQLSVNMHTVRSAYRKLENRGLVETRQGAGTRILPYDPQRFLHSTNLIRSNMLGVILPDINNPFYGQIVRGIESVARPKDYLLLVCNTHDEPDETLRYFQKLAEKKVDGILCVSYSLEEHLPGDDQAPRALPIVTVDWEQKTANTVTSDLESGVFQAVRHLVEHGHRRIGLISYAIDIPCVAQMKAGYRRALQSSGLAVDPALAVGVHGFLASAGEEGARQLFEQAHPPTAIVATSDMMAIGALRAIKFSGRRVPQDIALVGMNDIPHADLIDPPLTTIHEPAYEMGREAMQMLDCLVEGQLPPSPTICLPTSLVLRRSCGCGAG